VWEGRCRSHVQNALWKKEIFAANRELAPETEQQREALLATLKREVVAIDPSGCAGESDSRSDEVGIIVVGIGHDGIGRILEDATGRYSPDEWAHKALELFDRWRGDKIVAEKNFGGAMVESTIRTARRHAPIRLLNASRGKVQRAEPVAALYAQGKVRHVGHFLQLERQYCLFSTAGWSTVARIHGELSGVSKHHREGPAFQDFQLGRFRTFEGDACFNEGKEEFQLDSISMPSLCRRSRSSRSE